MSLRFIHRLIRNLVLPNNAGPGDPRIVIGPDIPDELTTFYNTGPQSITSVILWYYGNATDTYHYYGVVDLGGGAPPGTVVRGDVLVGTVIPLDTYSGADYILHRTLSIDPLDPTVGIVKDGINIFDLQSWTPAPTGTMNFGTGAVASGFYTRIGDRYWVEANITLGAEPALSIGDASITLPVTPASSNVTNLGLATYQDVSTGTIVKGTTRRFTTGMRCEYDSVVGANVVAAVITDALPFVFAAGDFIRFQATFYV